MQKEHQTIWTIGHSTHPFAEFIAMLQSFQIELMADIRNFPGSRKFPQYNEKELEIALPQNGIHYVHLKELGGRRKANPHSKNTGWRSMAFRGYADYMETAAFKHGTQELINLASTQRVAYMCSEAVWWRCHRSLVSDYLKLQGWKVMHIMGTGKAAEHPYTAPARIVQSELNYGLEEKK